MTLQTVWVSALRFSASERLLTVARSLHEGRFVCCGCGHCVIIHVFMLILPQGLHAQARLAALIVATASSSFFPCNGSLAALVVAPASSFTAC